MKVFCKYKSTDNELKEKFFWLLAERQKYFIMWELRSLEKEIVEEDGQIIIVSEGERPGFELIEFSEELTEKIKAILASLKFPDMPFESATTL